jgi:hypothetical protein
MVAPDRPPDGLVRATRLEGVGDEAHVIWLMKRII